MRVFNWIFRLNAEDLHQILPDGYLEMSVFERNLLFKDLFTFIGGDHQCGYVVDCISI